MPLRPQRQNLLLRETSETKHANLGSDMIPRTRGTPLLQTIPETLPHLQNAATHRAQIRLPLLKKNRIVQHTTSNARTVSRRVRDLRSLEDSQLRRDVRASRRGIRTGSGDEVEGACALAVETEVLGEGLRNAQLEALLDEVADRPGVADEIAGCEALVGGVEEGEVRARAHHLGDLLPLVFGGIDACWVVRAGVEEDYGALGGGFEGGYHAVEVKAFGFGGEVGVLG